MRAFLEHRQALAQYLRGVESKGGIEFRPSLKLPCLANELQCLGGWRREAYDMTQVRAYNFSSSMLRVTSAPPWLVSPIFADIFADLHSTRDSTREKMTRTKIKDEDEL